jgi:hypothetical protein
MGFHRRHIPDLERLKEIRTSCNSDEEFLEKILGKADAIIGSVESVRYMDEVYENHKKTGEQNDDGGRD